MPKVEQEGQYIGTIVDHGVSESSQAKVPQFICTIKVTQHSHDEGTTWEDWSEYSCIITGFLTLATFDAQGQVAKCFNFDQVMEATGWNGMSYSGLAAMDLKGTEVKVLVAIANDPKYGLQVKRIGAVDTSFGIRKLSEKDLKAMDKKFALPSQAKKPVSAPQSKKIAPPKVSKTSEEKPGLPGCTEKEAWKTVSEKNEALGGKQVDEERLVTYWSDAAESIAIDSGNITDEEWAKIRDEVLSDIDIPF